MANSSKWQIRDIGLAGTTTKGSLIGWARTIHMGAQTRSWPLVYIVFINWFENVQKKIDIVSQIFGRKLFEVFRNDSLLMCLVV